MASNVSNLSNLLSETIMVSMNDVNMEMKNTFDNIGDLQEAILSKFRLTIYDINFIKFDNKIFGLEYPFTSPIIIEEMKNLEIVKKTNMDEENTRRQYINYIQCREDAKIAFSLSVQPQYPTYPMPISILQNQNMPMPYVNGNTTQVYHTPRVRQVSELYQPVFQQRLIGRPMENLVNMFINSLINGGGMIPSQTSHKILATEEDINELLKTDTYENLLTELKHDTTDCNICLEEYKNDDMISLMPTCNCCYHFECIKKWLTEESNKCPICRTKINQGTREDILHQSTVV